MKDLIIDFKDTGPCIVDVDKVVKAWTNEFSITQWKDEYRLIKGNGEECAKVSISKEQALDIILKAKLLPIKDVLFASATTYRSKDNIASELKRLKEIEREKQSELQTIKEVINTYETPIRETERKAEIKRESNFNSWKEAKIEINHPHAYVFDHFSEEYRKKLISLDENFWKRALTEELSYEDQYLAIMQYECITCTNAAMGRNHGLGTFGYRYKGITEEEHKKMDEISSQNFKTYLKKINFDEFEDFEGVRQDGEGGWNFEELEDK